MKNKSILLGLLSVMVVLMTLSSCENGDNGTLPPESITIIKLKKNEYKDFIIATLVNGADSITAYRASKLGAIGKSGFSPYWELSGNWLLVDWKWPSSFPYRPLADNVLLENESWDKLESELQKWPLETPYIAQPIENVYNIKASKLAEFQNKAYKQEVIAHVINRPSMVDADEKEKEQISKEMDAIWTMFQMDLSTVIEDGDLEKLLNLK